MTKKEKIKNFIEEYNGYLITSLVCSEDISKTYIAKYIKEHGMEKVSRGVYIADDVWPDELFILQQRNSAIIYSGETALYLHGLTDREYSSVCVTVPQGYNASHLKDNDFNVSVKYAAPDLYKILLMFVKQIFEDFENLENKKESNLNKTCCCRPAVNSYNESGQIYLYNSIARA